MGFCVRSETKLGAVVGSGCDCGEFWGRKRGCGSSALELDEFCTSSRTHTHAVERKTFFVLVSDDDGDDGGGMWLAADSDAGVLWNVFPGKVVVCSVSKCHWLIEQSYNKCTNRIQNRAMQDIPEKAAVNQRDR